MALYRGNDIPTDAVVLDELEATQYIWSIVSDWEHTSDVWALRYSSYILGGVSAVSGLMINRFYRGKLKLGTYGYIASTFPITAMPAVLTALFHRYLVTTDMLLMKSQACPICYEIRSGAIQASLGIAYPMVLGPVTALMLANRYNTARIPDLGDGPKTMFKFLRKVTKPFVGTLTFLTVSHLFASSVLTYFEMRNNYNLRLKILEIEAKHTANENS